MSFIEKYFLQISQLFALFFCENQQNLRENIFNLFKKSRAISPKFRFFAA